MKTKKFYEPTGYGIGLTPNIGPGPVHFDKTKNAIKALSDAEKEKLMAQSMKHYNARDFTDRFDITSKLAYPEYMKDNQMGFSSRNVPGPIYKTFMPKRDTSPKIGTEPRKCVNPIKRNDNLPSPHTYDINSNYTNVSVKNLNMYESVAKLNQVSNTKESRTSLLLPIFEQ